MKKKTENSNNWMQKAVKRPGALKAKAKAAGAVDKNGNISKSWIDEKADMKAKTADQKRTKKQAALAKVFSKSRKKSSKKSK